MASGMFNSARQAFGRGEIDWEDADINVLLVDDGYTFDEADEFVSDLVASECGATDYARQDVVGRTVSDATVTAFDCTNPVWAGLGNGVNEAVGGAVFYVHNADDAAAKLIVFVDFTNFTTQDMNYTLVIPVGGVFNWAG